MIRKRKRPQVDRADALAKLPSLLRQSHLFSSAVREVLQEGVLTEVSPNRLTLPQFHLLKLIALNGHHQVRQVAEFLGVSVPAASKNIDKLVRLGLLTRAVDEEDRRAAVLALSRKGRRLVQQYEERIAEVLCPVMEEFDADELTQLIGLLSRFSMRLYQARLPDKEYCLRCGVYGEEGCAVGHMQGFCPYETVRGHHVTSGSDGGGP